MANLIKKLARTKLSGQGTKNMFARILKKEIIRQPNRESEFRFIAIEKGVNHLVNPLILN